MKYIQKDSAESRDLLGRFLDYVKICSTSSSKNADNGKIPSTKEETEFATRLADDMKAAGLSGVLITEYSYVYGFLDPSAGCSKVSPFCLLAHMDTVEEVCGKNVKPTVIRDYRGNTIPLGNGIVLDPKTDPALARAGKELDTIITTDGTTLLGADDKAGIAVIMAAIQYISGHPEIKHGKIEVLFSPDEETGHGMDKVPINLISSKCGYTVDGGHIGELETECFNAFRSDITFTGRATHTGTARAGKMVNAVTMAGAFIAALPHREAPETTDGYEGFYAPMEVTGSIEASHVTLFLRDFTSSGIDRRRELVREIAQATAHSFGGTVEVIHSKQYLNMKQKLDEHPEVVQHLTTAFKKAGIEPLCLPIRGGTDGSRLTEMGIPTPNMFTGGHNYHSRTEWASLSQMCAAAEVIINLAAVVAT